MAIIFAFCCIFCSAMNDFVFKLFARKPRSRGLFVFMIGVAWAAASSFLPDLRGASWNTTILWGIISGLFSVIGNLLLIEAMGKQSAGLCSTIYRLNLALVVPGAWILFKEQNSLLQCIGIAAAFAAVLFFLPGSKNPNSDTSPRDAKLGLILVIIAAILRDSGHNRGDPPRGDGIGLQVRLQSGSFGKRGQSGQRFLLDSGGTGLLFSPGKKFAGTWCFQQETYRLRHFIRHIRLRYRIFHGALSAAGQCQYRIADHADELCCHIYSECSVSQREAHSL